MLKWIDGGVCAAKGFRAAGIHVGVKTHNINKKDVALIVSDVDCTAAGVFTTNVVKAAPLQVTRTHLANGKARAVIVNSGNANACAPQGEENALRMCAAAARAIGCAKVYHEKIKTIGWISIATAFCGVLVLLLWDGVFSINVGLIWTMGAALVFFGYNMISRLLTTKDYTALEIVTYSMIFGALLLGFWSVQGFHQLASSDLPHIMALVYLGAFPSAAAYFLWGKAMSFANRTSEVTNFMFVIPLLSTILGFLILREVPNMGTFLGGAIIICSIIVFNLKGK